MVNYKVKGGLLPICLEEDETTYLNTRTIDCYFQDMDLIVFYVNGVEFTTDLALSDFEQLLII